MRLPTGLLPTVKLYSIVTKSQRSICRKSTVFRLLFTHGPHGVSFEAIATRKPVTLKASMKVGRISGSDKKLSYRRQTARCCFVKLLIAGRFVRLEWCGYPMVKKIQR